MIAPLISGQVITVKTPIMHHLIMQHNSKTFILFLIMHHNSKAFILHSNYAS